MLYPVYQKVVIGNEENSDEWLKFTLTEISLDDKRFQRHLFEYLVSDKKRKRDHNVCTYLQLR